MKYKKPECKVCGGETTNILYGMPICNECVPKTDKNARKLVMKYEPK